MILAITNLYPRPDEPERGVFNARLFRALSRYEKVHVLVPVFVRPFAPFAVGRWASASEDGLAVTYVRVPFVPVLSRPWNASLLSRALKPYLNMFSEASFRTIVMAVSRWCGRI